MTKRLFGVIVLMMLMMATSLSAHATFKIVGSVIGWDASDGIEMTQDADGFWTITREFAADEEFKFIDGATWVGAESSGSFYITQSMLDNGTSIKLGVGDSYKNLRVTVAGTYKIVFDATGSTNGENYSMRIGKEAPVSIATGIANGTLAVNKTAAIPGETVRITVTPGNGYYIERDNITVEKTIDGGSAQAPRPKADGPGVGSFVDVEGNPINSVDQVNTYTFAMPATPYGAKVSAEFQNRIAITAIDPIADQTYTGEAIEPAVVVKAGETTLGEGDYTVEYSNNTAAGQATVTVTGKGKYTGTLTANFNIVKVPHNVTIAASIVNGTVVADPTSAVEGTTINLTVTPNAGYEIEEIYYMNGNEKVVVEGTSFVMPDFDVEINATFKAINYTITVTQGANGTIAADKETAIVGETVTLTNTPDADCAFVKYTVMAGEEEVPVTDGKFTMPAANVTVTATFKAYDVTYMIKWGEGSEWTEINDIEMTKDEEGKWITATGTALTAADEFKVYKDVRDGETEISHAWLGKDYTVTALPAIIEGLAENTPNIKLSKAGTYNFIYNPETKTLEVTGEVEPDKYTITCNQAENGEVKADKAEAAAGETVTLTVTPAEGYELETLTVMNGETPVEVAEDNTFLMPAGNVAVTATFKAIDYSITVDQNIANGKVTADKATAHVGETVTLTNTPNEDCEFVSYTVMAGETPVEVTGNTFVMPAANVTVTATFKAYEVTYMIKWGEGSEWGDNIHDIAMTKGNDGKWSTTEGTALTAANEFKVYKDVRDGETEISHAWLGKDYTVTTLPATIEGLAENTPNIKLSKAGTYNFIYNPETKTLEVTGEVEPDKYTITCNQAENGEVKADKAEAAAGETVTLTVTPAEGYELETLTVMNGETAVEVAADNTFTMPAGNVVVTATFKAIGYNVRIMQSENGTVTANKTTANVGDEIELTITANEDCVFESLKVIGDESHETVQVTDNKFTMPAENVTITASFKAYDVTYMIKWGEGSTWPTTYDIAMTKGDDGKWTTAEGTAMAADDSFKVYKYVHDGDTYVSHKWLGKEYTVETLPATITELSDAEGTPNIVIGQAGTYNFTYEPATNTLVVTGEVAPEKYSITCNEAEHGKVVADMAEAAEGEKVTLTITPDAGYELDVLTVMNGETAVEVAADNTFTMPAGNVVVTATFKKSLVTSQLTWSVTPAESGTVVVKAGETVLETSPADVLEGTKVTITATPANGYELDAITVMNGETAIELAEDNSFDMPAANVTITVAFKTVTYDLEGVTFTTDRQWATYYNSRNLALPEGMKAYVVNGVVNDAADITEVPYIPAGVGVLLYSENVAENITTVAYTGELGSYTSKLVGSNEAQEIAEGAGYVLYNNVFTLSEGGTVAAHRCYLPVNVTTNAPRVLRIGYDGSVTAIETLIATGNVTAVKYVNMSGVTSDMPFRGVNIAVVTFTDGTTKTVKFVK